jgi:hypothetical protein
MRGFDAAHAASRKSAEHSVSFKASEGGSSPPEFVVEFGVVADKILTDRGGNIGLPELTPRRDAGCSLSVLQIYVAVQLQQEALLVGHACPCICGWPAAVCTALECLLNQKG